MRDLGDCATCSGGRNRPLREHGHTGTDITINPSDGKHRAGANRQHRPTPDRKHHSAANWGAAACEYAGIEPD